MSALRRTRNTFQVSQARTTTGGRKGLSNSFAAIIEKAGVEGIVKGYVRVLMRYLHDADTMWRLQVRAITFEGVGDANVLRLVDEPMPEIRSNDLLVRTHAAGVNRADILHRQGVYGPRPDFGDSLLPGLEIAGEVVEVGPKAEGFEVKDRVMAIVGGGGYAEYARVDSRMCIPIPERLS